MQPLASSATTARMTSVPKAPPVPHVESALMSVTPSSPRAERAPTYPGQISRREVSRSIPARWWARRAPGNAVSGLLYFAAPQTCRNTMTHKDKSAPIIRAPRGASLRCRGWHQEAAMRMLMNNLDPEVAEHPEKLVVYGGTGKAARNHDSYRAIVSTLERLKDDETLLVQSGKPVGVIRTHDQAPRVLIANSNLVGRWAN